MALSASLAASEPTVSLASFVPIVGTGAADQIHYPRGTPPDEILGAALHTWLRADSAGDFTLDDGTDVVTWTNRGGTGNPTQATDSKQPTFQELGLGGKPSVAFSSAPEECLTVVLGSALAAGSRPYLWVVAQATGSNPSGTQWVTFQNDALDSLVYLTNNATNWRLHANVEAGGALEQITGPVLDLNPHLFEFGALTATPGKFRVDGVAYDTGAAYTDGVFKNLTRLTLSGVEFGGSFFSHMNARLGSVVVATSIPTAAQLTAMRSYFRDRYGLTVTL